ncbi:hypothetical protein MNB_SV-6-1633 [hydrothermal vent metagenome]|uniref:Porin domain-containing protein n=1 Tax=hydrothermal vent metagenome TaxID=652676 RepID=A0A1W1BRA0_9ZZZZ
MKLTKISLLAALAISGAVAGGNVEKVEVAVVEEVLSNWDFSGQAVLYYQTMDKTGDVDLFSQESGRANAGLQLNAVGKFDYGLSVGAQVTGLGTLGLQNEVVSNIMQSADGNLNGGAVTKLYMAWSNEANTIKIGRQELPKSLSPFAWSEGWNVFKNTYEAALYVNTMIPSTVLVGAWVSGANQNGVGAWDGNGNWLMNSGSNLNEFNDVNGDDGIFMVTAQNKSINGLTITGSVYYAPSLLDNMMSKAEDLAGEPHTAAEIGDDATIIWGDISYANADFPVTFAAQGGQVSVGGDTEDTTAFGAKIGANYNVFGFTAAYSSVDEGTTGVFNVGGVKTPLYTQMILNQNFIASNADTILLKATAKALGGKFIAQYGMTTMNDRDLLTSIGDIDYNEFDFIYKTKVWNDNITLLAAYVNQDLDAKVVTDSEGNAEVVSPDANNVIRFWARYNF